MEEVEFLCDDNGTGKKGRIGILETGRLIELGTLGDLRAKYGEALIVKQKDDRIEYKFFPTLPSARAYLDTLADKTGVLCRPSHLEDIFVELTGHRLD
jgi:ABC-2 type transport system ATP-binding protein